MTEPVYALSIGSVEGGSSAESRQWRDGITRLTQRVAEAREGLAPAVNLNVVFQVPGDLVRPDFEGVRTGHFSKQQNLLVVQVALPEHNPLASRPARPRNRAYSMSWTSC